MIPQKGFFWGILYENIKSSKTSQNETDLMLEVVMTVVFHHCLNTQDTGASSFMKALLASSPNVLMKNGNVWHLWFSPKDASITALYRH